MGLEQPPVSLWGWGIILLAELFSLFVCVYLLLGRKRPTKSTGYLRSVPFSSQMLRVLRKPETFPLHALFSGLPLPP